MTNERKKASGGPRRTSRAEHPVAFWSEASALASGLANQGAELTSNPLVWVAALEMAQEAVLGMGGEAMRADWLRAQAGRLDLAVMGTTFSVERESDDSGEEDSVSIERGRSDVSKELAAYEAVPIAERKIWITTALSEAFDRSVLGLPDLEAAVEGLSRRESSSVVVRGLSLRFQPRKGGRWVVGLEGEVSGEVDS